MITSKVEDVEKRGVSRVVLCAVQGCCPIVEIDHQAEKIVITDDFGGKVTLTMQEWREAVEKVVL